MTYWKKQSREPLYKNLDFARPEQKSQSGTLTIIGGHSGNFRTIVKSAETAEQLGVNKLQIILPDSLTKTIPHTPSITFASSEQSGGFNKAAEPTLLAATSSSDITLLIGDLGKNAETATAIASVIKVTTQTKPLVITRDAIDLITPEASLWIDSPHSLTLQATLPQLQKLFRTIYYPRVITLSQPLNQLVETLHKFTLSYPTITIATLHTDQYIVAGSGTVTTTTLSHTSYSPITIFAEGILATRTAIYQIRQPHHPLESTTSAILS